MRGGREIVGIMSGDFREIVQGRCRLTSVRPPGDPPGDAISVHHCNQWSPPGDAISGHHCNQWSPPGDAISVHHCNQWPSPGDAISGHQCNQWSSM